MLSHQKQLTVLLPTVTLQFSSPCFPLPAPTPNLWYKLEGFGVPCWEWGLGELSCLEKERNDFSTFVMNFEN